MKGIISFNTFCCRDEDRFVQVVYFFYFSVIHNHSIGLMISLNDILSLFSHTLKGVCIDFMYASIETDNAQTALTSERFSAFTRVYRVPYVLWEIVYLDLVEAHHQLFLYGERLQSRYSFLCHGPMLPTIP